MSITYDNKEQIARSNIHSIFGKLFRSYTENNDDGEVILYEAGLSSLVDEYSFLRIRTGLIEDIRIITISTTQNMSACLSAKP